MMVWPETDSAVQTMPAMAMTKNMPVVPAMPKRSSTTDEMMIVSIVMPETGLRAVVAMALAATEVKKNEKSSVSADADQRRAPAWRRRLPKNTATASAPTTTPTRMVHEGHVAVGALAAGVSPRGTPARQWRRSRPRSAAT